jgi:uncharacterized DUF497 family protein
LGRYDWDENNIGHIAAHGVTPAEIEEVFARGVLVLEMREKGGEDRVIAAVKTAAGRVLQVVYTMRSGRIRVITAHESRRLRKLYETQRKGPARGSR